MYLDGQKKQIISWVRQGLSDRVIAERARVSPSTVRYWRERNGIARPARNGLQAPPGVNSRPKPAREAEQIARQLRRVKAFGDLLSLACDTDRLAMIFQMERDGESLSGAFVEALGKSPPSIRHHLYLMRHGRLVTHRTRGRQVIYGLDARGRILVELARNIVAAHRRLPAE